MPCLWHLFRFLGNKNEWNGSSHTQPRCKCDFSSSDSCLIENSCSATPQEWEFRDVVCFFLQQLGDIYFTIHPRHAYLFLCCIKALVAEAGKGESCTVSSKQVWLSSWEKYLNEISGPVWRFVVCCGDNGSKYIDVVRFYFSFQDSWLRLLDAFWLFTADGTQI